MQFGNKIRRKCIFGISVLALCFLCSCALSSKKDELMSKNVTQNVKDNKDSNYISSDALTNKEEDINMSQTTGWSTEKRNRLEGYFKGIKATSPLKTIINNNPLMTQRLGADPYVIEYDGRVYVYMTGDVVERDSDGNVKDNSYSRINKLNVISSEDLVNWTDHGTIHAAGNTGSAKWGNNSWAPAVARKEVDGKMKFFIYFANGGNGIGVLTSDSPTGPFKDPLGGALISRNTPNCANVTWLFDPAVLVDDDGKAYLYFGGGIPEGKQADPGTGRVVELGKDMISLAGEPTALSIPYLFEDSGINKIGNTYYYSYCSNWQVSAEATKELGFGIAQIVYMTSDNPMGPFTLQGPILRNPGDFFGSYGNNHHCIFQFKDKYYIAYHTQMLESRLGISGGYRSTNINELKVNEDGSLASVFADEVGVDQVSKLNPYSKVEAETMATMAGISTTQCDAMSILYGSGNMAVNEIDTGDWIALKGVDFGTEGANKFTVSVNLPKESIGAIQIRKDQLFGEVIGYVELTTDNKDEYVEITEQLLATVTGEHDLYFVFYGTEYSLDYWYFQ